MTDKTIFNLFKTSKRGYFELNLNDLGKLLICWRGVKDSLYPIESPSGNCSVILVEDKFYRFEICNSDLELTSVTMDSDNRICILGFSEKTKTITAFAWCNEEGEWDSISTQKTH